MQISSWIPQDPPPPLQVRELIGMAPLKAFLKELEAKVTYVQGGGDSRLLEGCLNVVLSNSPPPPTL